MQDLLTKFFRAYIVIFKNFCLALSQSRRSTNIITRARNNIIFMRTLHPLQLNEIFQNNPT